MTHDWLLIPDEPDVLKEFARVLLVGLDVERERNAKLEEQVAELSDALIVERGLANRAWGAEG